MLSDNNNLSSKDYRFRQTVKEWLNEQGELLVLIRYSHAAGSRDYLLVDEPSQFEDRLDKLRPMTSIIVFRQPQLPLRGIVDSQFIEMALQTISEGTEYLALYLDEYEYPWSHFHHGDSKEELRADLQEWLGKRAAFGPYPPWLEDNEDVISAIVPGPDGVVRVGVY
ncbi:MAG: hypothetical protein M3441_11865 [Chloroflexota bacterium]|nr:hypothetical protein [Chloroflexota bacterium]